jgi:hypothetical protein
MAVSENEKDYLEGLLIKRNQLLADPEAAKIQQSVEEIRLDNISALDLKLICNHEFVVGIDFESIDTSAPFTVRDMNLIAPGAIDPEPLRRKMMFGDHTLLKSSEVIDSQSGPMVVTDESILNTDIETLVESKTISQGINLKMINAGKLINPESSAGSDVPSKFVGE